jgi:hypothetical protein
MAADGARPRHRALTLVMVVGASFLLGYLGMPAALHAMASLGLAFIGIGTVRALELGPRSGPPPAGNSSANAVG